MKNGEFSAKIIEQTLLNCRFEEKRDYVSLSQISQPVEELVRQYREGYISDENGKLKCYKGYQMENDLLKRVKAAYGEAIILHPEVTYSACPNLIKGHPDFKYNEYPGDSKSIAVDEWLPKDGYVSKRIYMQMQAYMLCMGVDKSVVLFESRETGKMLDIWVHANDSMQNIIELKLIEVIKILG